MRRTALLIEFSREHHASLKLVRHLRALGTAAPPASLLEELAAQAGELQRHFAAEEALLLPRLNAAGPTQQALATRLLAEHRDLRALLAAPPQPATLAALAELLEAHVRFEERQLFPAVEALSPDDGAAQ